jgi:hypothetical protein
VTFRQFQAFLEDPEAIDHLQRLARPVSGEPGHAYIWSPESGGQRSARQHILVSGGGVHALARYQIP